jgi:hypothetical protein
MPDTPRSFDGCGVSSTAIRQLARALPGGAGRPLVRVTETIQSSASNCYACSSQRLPLRSHAHLVPLRLHKPPRAARRVRLATTTQTASSPCVVIAPPFARRARCVCQAAHGSRRRDSGEQPSLGGIPSRLPTIRSVLATKRIFAIVRLTSPRLTGPTRRPSWRRLGLIGVSARRYPARADGCDQNGEPGDRDRKKDHR